MPPRPPQSLICGFQCRRSSQSPVHTSHITGPVLRVQYMLRYPNPHTPRHKSHHALGHPKPRCASCLAHGMGGGASECPIFSVKGAHEMSLMISSFSAFVVPYPSLFAGAELCTRVCTAKNRSGGVSPPEQPPSPCVDKHIPEPKSVHNPPPPQTAVFLRTMQRTRAGAGAIPHIL